MTEYYNESLKILTRRDTACQVAACDTVDPISRSVPDVELRGRAAVTDSPHWITL